MKDKQALVLASSSRYRRQLLSQLGVDFQVDDPAIDERLLAGESVSDSVRRLSEAKARACAPRHPDALIIGSDQLCALNGSARGKPGNRANAIAQLSDAAGRAVTFFTGVAVLEATTTRMRSRVVPTTVHFRALTQAQIEDYVDREQPFDCAGAFRSEGLGIALFERIEGDDPTALVGLPLIALTDLLIAAGCPPLGATDSA